MVTTQQMNCPEWLWLLLISVGRACTLIIGWLYRNDDNHCVRATTWIRSVQSSIGIRRRVDDAVWMQVIGHDSNPRHQISMLDLLWMDDLYSSYPLTHLCPLFSFAFLLVSRLPFPSLVISTPPCFRSPWEFLLILLGSKEVGRDSGRVFERVERVWCTVWGSRL